MLDLQDFVRATAELIAVLALIGGAFALAIVCGA